MGSRRAGPPSPIGDGALQGFARASLQHQPPHGFLPVQQPQGDGVAAAGLVIIGGAVNGVQHPGPGRVPLPAGAFLSQNAAEGGFLLQRLCQVLLHPQVVVSDDIPVASLFPHGWRDAAPPLPQAGSTGHHQVSGKVRQGPKLPNHSGPKLLSHSGPHPSPRNHCGSGGGSLLRH